MTYPYKRVKVAYEDADPKPDLMTLSRDDWHVMFDGYNVRIRDTYIARGFYRIVTRKERLRRQAHHHDGLPAFTFRGVPVVIREDYDEMMRGHSSRRIVLAV